MGTAGATQEPWAASTAAAAAHGFGLLEHVEVTGSTNTDLADRARDGHRDPIVRVADHQTAGRGRLDRTWEDAPGGSLLVSVALPVRDGDEPSLLPVVVAAAARAAAEMVCPVAVLARWPNDLVVVDGHAPGKLAGVLAELVDGDPPVVVAGLGLNIEPVDVAGATSVASVGGHAVRDDLLAAVIEGVARRRGDPASALDELRHHSATLGREIAVVRPQGRVEGRAVEILDDGRLVLDDGTARHVIAIGDVIG